MDGFNDRQRIEALKKAKCTLESDLEIFKQEEIDAFKVVEDLDKALEINETPELKERRRQKYVFAKGLKWNILSQEKEIERCEQAIAMEENKICNLELDNTLMEYQNK